VNMSVRVVIHEEGDHIFTVSQEGTLRAYVINENGSPTTTVVADAIEHEQEYQFHADGN